MIISPSTELAPHDRYHRLRLPALAPLTDTPEKCSGETMSKVIQVIATWLPQ